MEDSETRNAAPRKSRSRWSYVKEKLTGTITISLVSSLVIHVAMLIIGAVKFRKCPVEPNIPVFLVAAGVIGILSKVLSMARNVTKKYIKTATILTIVYTAELLFFIYGSYWVYKEYEPQYSPKFGMRYCDKLAYIFAITYVSFVYFLLFLFVLGLLCFIGCVLTCEKCVNSCIEDDDEEQPTETKLT